MGDTPAFQGHHVIEQEAYRQSRLLRELSAQGLFDLDGPRNMLNLPQDRALAARLGLSPHPGGPLGAIPVDCRKSSSNCSAVPTARPRCVAIVPPLSEWPGASAN